MIYDHEVVYLIRIVIHLCKLVFTTKFDYWSSQPVHRSGVWRSIVDLYWGRHDFVNPANEPSWRVFRWPPHSNHILDFESTSVISTTLKTTVIAALLKIWCITFRFDVNSVLCVLFFIWHFGVQVEPPSSELLRGTGSELSSDSWPERRLRLRLRNSKV